MATITTSRHLLFGILALQNGFISKEDLVAATSVWLEDKAVPMSHLLQEKFGLDPDVRALVEALVEKHLELHDGDLDRSLAAISSVGSVRDELMRLGDLDVQASLTAIPEGTLAPVSSPGETFSADTSTKRFRILRMHAKGGLGKVSLATDEELQREVALKELLPQRADVPDSRARFLKEAQITGQLEHPGVVPIYGLGQYADGRPFYAMRFIRGDSLQEAIAKYHSAEVQGAPSGERSLQLRQLLRRFIDVCNAIDYAHSRHILHRDLKPGNIMLGRYGETLVVDWGLAKSFDQTGAPDVTPDGATLESMGNGSVPTQQGSAVGTPAYMSPEQAAGRLEDMGAASDIYSLGATLHCLLTGKAPSTGTSVEQILSQVRSGDVPTPIKVNPDVPKPLNAICRKAMALRPGDRYGSARALADDVERWLADEPVTAYPDTATMRAARWMRRHRTAVQTAFAALLLLAVVASIAALMINKARTVAEAALAAEQQARVAEQQARQEAIQQRDRAAQNFGLAQNAVDDLFTRVSESTLLNQPGTQAIRRDLLEQARDYYQSFVTVGQESAELADDVAASKFRLGRIMELAGSRQEAITTYEQVENEQRNLLLLAPQDPERMQELCMTLNAIGRAHHELGNLDQARTHYDDARQLREHLVSVDSDNHEYHRLLANSLMNLGLVARDLGNLEEAQQLANSAQDLRRRRIEQGDGRPAMQVDLGQGYFNLAVFAAVAGDSESAREPLQQAVAIFEGLEERAGEEDFDHIANLHRLALCYRLLGDLQFWDVTSDQASQWYESARYHFEQLVLQNPIVPRYENDLANLMVNIADRQRRREDVQAARQSFERASQILLRLWQRFAEPAYLRNAAVAQRELALCQGQLGETQQAVATLDELEATLRSAEGDFSAELDEVQTLRQQLSEEPDGD